MAVDRITSCHMAFVSRWDACRIARPPLWPCSLDGCNRQAVVAANARSAGRSYVRLNEKTSAYTRTLTKLTESCRTRTAGRGLRLHYARQLLCFKERVIFRLVE